METDQRRIGAFKRAFAQFNNLQEAVVCEAGVGSLALSQHFLPYCKKAYLIENNPELILPIKEKLHKNGWTHKTELIVGDARQVELPEAVDFIVGELMSIFCANEYQVQIFRHLQAFLRPKGHFLPQKIFNLAQVGSAEFEDGHRHYPLLFTRYWPELLSTQTLLNTIDFHTDTPDFVSVCQPFQCILSGKANCILMQSFVQIAEGVNFTGTDSLMPPTVLQLQAEALLVSGQTYQLHLSFQYGGDLNDAVAHITAVT